MKKLEDFKIIAGPAALIESIQSKQESVSILANLDKLSEVCGVEIAAFLSVINKLLNKEEAKNIFAFSYPVFNELSYQDSAISSRAEGVLLEGKDLKELLGIDEGVWYFKAYLIDPDTILLSPIPTDSPKVTLAELLVDLEDFGVCRHSLRNSDLMTDFINATM